MTSTLKAKRHWFIALAFAFAVFIVMYFLFPIHYENGDDFNMTAFAAGAYGVRDYHLIFINVLIGKLLTLAYTIAPMFPWYGFLEYAILIISFAAVIYVIIRKKSGFTIILMGCFFIWFGYEYFVKLQFTKTAGIATAAGSMLLFFVIENKEESMRLEIVIGSLLLIMGSMYRFGMFASVLAVFIVYAVFVFSKEKQRLLIFLPALGISFLLFTADTLVYQSDAGWKDYKEFLNVERELNDYGYPDYETHQDAYNAADINENALAMYQHLNFSDPEKYNTKTLRILVDAKEKEMLGTISGFFRDCFLMWFRNYAYMVPVVILALLLMIKDRRKCALWLLSFGVVLALEIFLYFRGRYGMNRVDVGFFFALCLVAVLLLPKKAYRENEDRGRKMIGKYVFINCGAFIAMGVVFALQYSFRPLYQNGIDIEGIQAEASKAEDRNYYALICSDYSHLYLTAPLTNRFPLLYDPDDTVFPGSLTNEAVLGGWYAYSPIWRNQLAIYGVEDPFYAMRTMRGVYVAEGGASIDMIVQYLNDYYGDGYTATMIKVIPSEYGVPIYRIHNVETKKEQLPYSLQTVPDADDSLQYDAKSVVKIIDGEPFLVTEGYAFCPGDNSYSANVYILTYNKETGDSLVYDTLQYENQSAGDLFNGQYSSFRATIPLEEKIENNQIYLIYESEEKACKVDISGR